MRRTFRLLIAAIVVAAVPVVPTAAAAGVPTAGASTVRPATALSTVDEDFVWAVQPSGPGGPSGRSQFVYDATPGQQLTDHVAITNLSRAELTVTVYGTDAFNSAEGGFALLPASQKPVDLGAWTAVTGAGTFSVAAGKQVVLPFTVTVPANATPGDHAGGIIASVAQARTGDNGQVVNVDRRVAARVYLRVAGTLTPALLVDELQVSRDASWNPFGGSTVTVTYRLRNTGNVRVTATAGVRMSGPFGWTLATTDRLAVPELLPGNAITVTEQITGLPAPVRMVATVTVEPSTMEVPLEPTTRTAVIWAVPWPLVGLLLVLAAATLFLSLRRRVRARPTPPALVGAGV